MEDLAKLFEGARGKDAAEDLKLTDNRNKLMEDLAKLFEGARGKDATAHMTKLKDNCNKLREDLAKLFEEARGKDAAEDRKLKDNLNKLREDLAKLSEVTRGKDAAAHMTELKEYRSNCFPPRNIGYYDAFREQKEKVDFNANLNRLNLAATYDKLEEMVETHQVPDDFQFIEELIKEGTEYRLLVEPLDVANYYRLGKHEDSGHYMKNARPRRYKALEKWLADIKPQEKKMAVISGLPDITKDSCFWAHVEEVSWIKNNPKEKEEVKRTKCSEFQNYVKQLLDRNRNELVLDEVKAGDSTFVKWWNKLIPQEKQASPIANIFRGIN